MKLTKKQTSAYLALKKMAELKNLLNVCANAEVNKYNAMNCLQIETNDKIAKDCKKRIIFILEEMQKDINIL